MRIHQIKSDCVPDPDKRNLILKCKCLPQRLRKCSGDFRLEEDSIKVMTMQASKGLEWPVVAVVISDEERRARDVKKDGALEARLFYVATTRAIKKYWFLFEFRIKNGSSS